MRSVSRIGTVMSGLSRARQALRGALDDELKRSTRHGIEDRVTGDVHGIGVAIPAAQPSGFEMNGRGTEMVNEGSSNSVMALGIVGRVSLCANDHGRDFLARFEGGIGVIPVQNGAGTANPDGTFPNVKLNIVRGVNPAPARGGLPISGPTSTRTAGSESEGVACSSPAATASARTPIKASSPP